MTARLSPRGLGAGALAFTIWGLFPLYLHPLRAVPSEQIIAHRIVWSCAFILAWMLLRSELAGLRPIFRQPVLLSRLLLTALLISGNWLVYVWGVTHGHVVDCSLGYYINPLINVVLGIFVLHERLNRVQWLAVALAALGVAYLTYEAGHLPWIALCLAVSFSLYGLVRKVISVEALPGLATETVLLLPVALGYLVWCEAAGTAAFGHAGADVTALLVGAGLVTAVPLFLFAVAARLLPYSTVGVLQYIGPTLQLLCGVWVFHEPFAGARAAGFVLIWVALAVYALDGVRGARAASL
ncbi:MAG TPA: EamA family transporter RarD, partial [Steroidobacteraceae bacterium]|nr:EamA family transporter RarD [Steroidobacteraceae bacterium]